MQFLRLILDFYINPQKNNSFLYLDKKGGMEWLNQCTYDVCTIWKSKSDTEKLVDMLVANDKLMQVAERMQKLLAA